MPFLPATASRRRLSALAGGAVALAVSAPIVVWGQTPAATPQVTFTKDIAPILQRSCQNCHRPDSLAPMSLLTYEEVAARTRRPSSGAPSIRSKQGAMPPWYIEKDIGIQQYKNDISLSDEEDREDRARGPTAARRAAIPADMPPPLDVRRTPTGGPSARPISSSRRRRSA